MKIVIAPDSYKESLTAMEVATAIENGFKEIIPDAKYTKLPMADGGEGTVQSLVDATQGKVVSANVTGPLGEPVEGFYGVLGDGSTAVIEMAAASGLHLVEPSKRNPLFTTTFGTGELIRLALNSGIKHIILGIGGSATNDGGMGMAQALGARFYDKSGSDLGYGGDALSELARIDLSGLDKRLADVILEVACDVDNPLCGPKGASHVFGPQKGATPEMVEKLDTNLAHFADVIRQTTGIEVINQAGAGAAGGLGAALLGLLNAKLRAGINIVTDFVKLEQEIKDATLVITGEGRIDSQTIHGKTPIGVAKIAKKYHLPVIGIAGSVSKDCHVVYDHGIDAVYSVVLGATELSTALKEAKLNIEITARNIATALALRLK
ncbi:glycerate kinase [Vibrio pectenicida]|uniref:Glycerate kinase n=1 Tax=Vibrio pectenicida TaxID=62763 RepID=A0A3R9EGF2_9VIBR|nr:glycerate kinase [Vibrio pectenicida]RSD29845.1 glycerate kinase [Vibrio pectenicida]